MKKIIALLVACFAITTAHAETLASLDNKSGGRIDLNTAPIPASVIATYGICKDTFAAKAWGGDGPDIFGCWKQVEDTIVVNWILSAGIESHTYAIEVFTVNQETLKRIKGLTKETTKRLDTLSKPPRM